MPGPAPIPTKLKLLAGNPGKRRLNTAEPQPEAGELPAPDWLEPHAREEWERVVPVMRRCGVFTVADHPAILAYVSAYAALRACVEDGKRPSAAMIASLRQTAAELGLTPAARSRIVVNKPNAEEAADRYFAA